ncbi:MAG: hypothetical protein RID81_07160 [Sandaracinaceae bacterium]
MAKTLRVVAVPGRALPVPGIRAAFVGLTRAPADTPDDQIVHRVPGGLAYVSAGPVEVPSDRYHRQALRVGDLATAPAQKRSRPAAREES